MQRQNVSVIIEGVNTIRNHYCMFILADLKFSATNTFWLIQELALLCSMVMGHKEFYMMYYKVYYLCSAQKFESC